MHGEIYPKTIEMLNQEIKENEEEENVGEE